MNLKKALTLIIMFVAACVTPGVAQIYWSNQSPAGITDDIWCVTYANGIFAAVTNQGNLLTSTDELTWSSQTIDQGVWLVSIAYGNGTWVVVGNNGAILVSSDLKTWVFAKSVTNNKLDGVFYAGTIWVAVGEVGTILTSPDAQTWTLQPAISGVTGFLHGITYVPTNSLGVGAEIWICGQNGVLILGQVPGGSTSYSFGLYDVGHVLGGESTTQNLEAIIYPNIANASVAELESLNLVGAGWGGTIVDGVLNLGGGGPEGFGVITVTPSVIFRGLTNGNGYYVAAGEQGTIMSSQDGRNWTQRFSGDSPSTVSTSTLLTAAYSATLQ